MQPIQFNTIDNISAVLDEIKQQAHVPVSAFKVAAMAVNTEGLAVCATNWEFLQSQTGHSNTVHAEQAAVALARFYNLGNIERIYVTEWPCGHCRQFLCELGKPDLEIIHTPTNETVILRHLLTESFSWNPQSTEEIAVTARLKLSLEAEKLLSQTHHPYSETESAVIISTQSGKLYTGTLIESNAYNPTLPAFQAAWIAYWFERNMSDPIAKIVMQESKNNSIYYRLQAEDCIRSLQDEGLLSKAVRFEYATI